MTVVAEITDIEWEGEVTYPSEIAIEIDLEDFPQKFNFNCMAAFTDLLNKKIVEEYGPFQCYGDTEILGSSNHYILVGPERNKLLIGHEDFIDFVNMNRSLFFYENKIDEHFYWGIRNFEISNFIEAFFFIKDCMKKDVLSIYELDYKNEVVTGFLMNTETNNFSFVKDLSLEYSQDEILSEFKNNDKSGDLGKDSHLSKDNPLLFTFQAEAELIFEVNRVVKDKKNYTTVLIAEHKVPSEIFELFTFFEMDIELQKKYNIFIGEACENSTKRELPLAIKDFDNSPVLFKDLKEILIEHNVNQPIIDKLPILFEAIKEAKEDEFEELIIIDKDYK